MSYTVAEYICPVHGRFDALVERPVPDAEPCPCGEMSPWTISAPLGRVKMGEATQGGVANAEKASWTDTRELGEGMPYNEWKKKRAKTWRDYRYTQNKKDDRKGMA